MFANEIDMEIIKKTDYVPPSERNMNGHYHSQHSYQRQLGCGRVHDREWETPVNGRAKPRSAVPVPAPTQAATDGKRKGKPANVKPKSQGKNSGGHQRMVVQRSAPAPPTMDRVKGVVGYHQSATACYVGGMPGTVHDGGAGGGVYGVYAETKYIYAVNGLPGNPAQASAAAAFFAR
ncbi:hypothetical protein NQ317_007531 [Molorchus minor]|uniref:Uncharacterized protein n=1 Tax=Molorchus minor TaxID=1323400 RepID=A0ABQ9K457_9CUCU|nr:hypothetical protein NQ317_007531 [Molorchus minor]